MDNLKELTDLIKEISANQQSLHDDMSAIVDRVATLERTIGEHLSQTPEPPAVDMHQQYLAARALVVESGKCSTSFLQRIFRIGYSNAASLTDSLEENGVIGPYNGASPRKILMSLEDLEEIEEAENEAFAKKWSLLNPDVGESEEGDDELYEAAKQAAVEAGKCSVSYLQRKLRIGYSRSARLVDLLEERGVIGPENGSKPREIVGN